jgi:ABC-type multidrug transport system fused ATPase/permease subunit
MIMKEGYSFHSIHGEIEEKKEAAKVKPLTAAEHESGEEKPMSLADHWLTLRRSIEEKISPVPPETPEEKVTAKLLSELVTPSLLKDYKTILKNLNDKAKISSEHSQREFIDLDEDFYEDVEKWIDGLVNEVRGQNETGFDEAGIEELRAECWLYFDSLAIVMNTKSLESDAAEFYENNKFKQADDAGKKKISAELVAELQARYPMTKGEIGALVELVTAEQDKKDISPTILVKMIGRLWEEYELGDKKASIAKISGGYLLAKGIESFAPSLFQNLIAHDKFNVAVFLEYFGLHKVSDLIKTKTDIEMGKLMMELEHQINERITNSLFFQEFEFIHEKSLGEIYTSLERGKTAITELLREVFSEFAPTLSGVAMSAAFLAKINPILGGIGLCGLPVMYQIAKRHNRKIDAIYEQEKDQQADVTTRLGAVKSGFEEVKTSPNAPEIAQETKELMNKKDALSLRRYVERMKLGLTSMIPFDVSTVISAAVGGAFQEAGMISGGAVLSNIQYGDQLNRPVRELVGMYFNHFVGYIRDIERMDEVLGEYEKLDLPEGDKEAGRVPVSGLENFDISISNLRFKNILRGLSLEIKQGEYVSIAGASGAGKSTLLRNLVGLYRPEGGEIKIGGVPNDKIQKYGPDSIYSAMAYCNQSPQIFEGMTLRENLLLWSKDETVDDDKIKRVLADLHLEKLAGSLDEKVKTLSGGEKVRFGLARTLIKGAKIILLDEPTSSMDSENATEVRKVIGEIHAKYPATTIVCVSHDEALLKASGRTINITELQK